MGCAILGALPGDQLQRIEAEKSLFGPDLGGMLAVGARYEGPSDPAEPAGRWHRLSHAQAGSMPCLRPAEASALESRSEGAKV